MPTVVEEIRYYVLDRSIFEKVRAALGWTQVKFCSTLGFTQAYYHRWINNRSIAEKHFNILREIAPHGYKTKVDKAFERYIVQSAKGTTNHPTQRPGKAHLMINGRLVCEEDDYENVRYYRSHEYFLNQGEICETCRDRFLDNHPPNYCDGW